MERVKGSPKARGEQEKQTVGCRNISGNRRGSSRKFLLVGLVVVLSVVVGFKLIFVSSPEDEIRRLIRDVSKAVEHHNLPKSLSYVSSDYKDDLDLDKQTLTYIASQIFQAYPKLTVSSKIVSIVVQKDEAQADVIAEFLGTLPPQNPEDLLALRQSHRFLTTFRKERKEWKVVETKKPSQNLE